MGSANGNHEINSSAFDGWNESECSGSNAECGDISFTQQLRAAAERVYALAQSSQKSMDEIQLLIDKYGSHTMKLAGANQEHRLALEIRQTVAGALDDLAAALEQAAVYDRPTVASVEGSLTPPTTATHE